MVQIVANVVGGKETDQILTELAREYGPKNTRTIFNAPIRKALQPVFDQISRTTPVDSGALAESIALRVGRPTKKRLRDSDYVDEFTVAEGRVGWFWRKGDVVNSHQALAVEFGANNIGGHRVLRNALQKNQKAVVDIFAKELGQHITKTAQRLSRKAARGTLRR